MVRIEDMGCKHLKKWKTLNSYICVHPELKEKMEGIPFCHNCAYREDS